jgi:hypothetical protein
VKPLASGPQATHAGNPSRHPPDLDDDRLSGVDSPGQVMAAAVAALLGPEEASPADVRAAAQECLRLLNDAREAVLASMATTKDEATMKS